MHLKKRSIFFTPNTHVCCAREVKDASFFFWKKQMSISPFNKVPLCTPFQV